MIVKYGLGLCPCLVLDMHFSRVHIFPIHNANFSPNFFSLLRVILAVNEH